MKEATHGDLGGLAEFQDGQSSRTLVECLALIDLLKNCLINDTFVVRDELVRPIEFTELGLELVDELVKRPRSRPNEARLATFLTFMCPGGLLIKPTTDVDALRHGLNGEVVASRIRYPYIYERDLHDLAARLFPRKHELDQRKTWTLLGKLPVGVFQVGHTIVGPMGAVKGLEPRVLPPRHDVPGYLCSAPTCGKVHPLRLNTSEQARINKTTERLATAMRRRFGGDPNPYVAEVRAAIARHHHQPGDEFLPRMSIFDTLSDASSDQDLSLILTSVMRLAFKDAPVRSQFFASLGVPNGSPIELAEGLSRPATLQALMWFTTRDIVTVVDRLVVDGELSVGPQSLWTERVARHPSSERCQIGHLGARRSQGSVVSNLQRLLHRVYFEERVQDPEDLAYNLDLSLDPDLLLHAVEKNSPQQLTENAVLSNRRVSRRVTELLGITDAVAKRETLSQAILWKLGHRQEVHFRHLDDLLEHENQVRALVAERGDQEDLRGALSSMFAALEGALQLSIEFACWALTQDHVTSDDGFKYDPAAAEGAVQFLEGSGPDTEPSPLNPDRRNTLFPLGSAFGRLARLLKEADLSALRPTRDYPIQCTISGRPYAFSHVAPFANLSAESQERLMSSLKDIAKLVIAPSLLEVRNGISHGTRNFPQFDAIFEAVTLVGDVRGLLRADGLYPVTYVHSGTNQGPSGLVSRAYVNADGAVVNLHIPTWPIAANLPDGRTQLIVMPAAVLPGCGPLRFRVKATDHRTAFWGGWPRRWDVDPSSLGSPGASSAVLEQFEQADEAV